MIHHTGTYHVNINPLPPVKNVVATDNNSFGNQTRDLNVGSGSGSNVVAGTLGFNGVPVGGTGSGTGSGSGLNSSMIGKTGFASLGTNSPVGEAQGELTGHGVTSQPQYIMQNGVVVPNPNLTYTPNYIPSVIPPVILPPYTGSGQYGGSGSGQYGGGGGSGSGQYGSGSGQYGGTGSGQYGGTGSGQYGNGGNTGSGQYNGNGTGSNTGGGTDVASVIANLPTQDDVQGDDVYGNTQVVDDSPIIDDSHEQLADSLDDTPPVLPPIIPPVTVQDTGRVFYATGDESVPSKQAPRENEVLASMGLKGITNGDIAIVSGIILGAIFLRIAFKK